MINVLDEAAHYIQERYPQLIGNKEDDEGYRLYAGTSTSFFELLDEAANYLESESNGDEEEGR